MNLLVSSCTSPRGSGAGDLPPILDQSPGDGLDQPCRVQQVASFLSMVDSGYAARTGMLVFGSGTSPRGLVFVEQGRICWVAAPHTRRRLVQLLRDRLRDRAVAARLEDLVRECQQQGRPLGETLVTRGHLAPADLRELLLRHSVESLAAIEHDLQGPHAFRQSLRARYDAQFTFSPAELLTAYGALVTSPAPAAVLDRLQSAVGDHGIGLVFRVANSQGALTLAPCPVAASGAETLGIEPLRRLGRWLRRHVRTFGALETSRLLVHLDAHDRGLVCERSENLLSVVVCRDAAHTARALSVLTERLR